MKVSDKVKAILQLSGHKQMELAEHLGMTAQSMNNKFNRDSWSAKDLLAVAEFADCKLAFVLSDGSKVYLSQKETSPDE